MKLPWKKKPKTTLSLPTTLEELQKIARKNLQKMETRNCITCINAVTPKSAWHSKIAAKICNVSNWTVLPCVFLQLITFMAVFGYLTSVIIMRDTNIIYACAGIFILSFFMILYSAFLGPNGKPLKPLAYIYEFFARYQTHKNTGSLDTPKTIIDYLTELVNKEEQKHLHNPQFVSFLQDTEMRYNEIQKIRKYIEDEIQKKGANALAYLTPGLERIKELENRAEELLQELRLHENNLKLCFRQYRKEISELEEPLRHREIFEKMEHLDASLVQLKRDVEGYILESIQALHTRMSTIHELVEDTFKGSAIRAMAIAVTNQDAEAANTTMEKTIKDLGDMRQKIMIEGNF